MKKKILHLFIVITNTYQLLNMVQCFLISIYFDISFTIGGKNGANFNDELNKFYHINMELKRVGVKRIRMIVRLS